MTLSSETGKLTRMNHPKKPDAGKPTPFRESVDYAEQQRRSQRERDAALTSEHDKAVSSTRPHPPNPHRDDTPKKDSTP